MDKKHLAFALAGTLILGACTEKPPEPIAPAPPIGPGAWVGTVAADRNGDGIADGYYSPDGVFHPFIAPPCPPPPPPPPKRSGERG